MILSTRSCNHSFLPSALALLYWFAFKCFWFWSILSIRLLWTFLERLYKFFFIALLENWSQLRHLMSRRNFIVQSGTTWRMLSWRDCWLWFWIGVRIQSTLPLEICFLFAWTHLDASSVRVSKHLTCLKQRCSKYLFWLWKSFLITHGVNLVNLHKLD